ncbi:MAG: type II secretion system F family protein [Calditrichaeota bacterium]|nr:type II secretion system F family protein [Calditrichota bacterium]
MFFQSVSQADIQLFTQQLATMVNAKLPLLNGLEILVKDQKNESFRQILKRIAKLLADGNPFSDSLAKYPLIFDKFYIQMVRIGEKTGQIGPMLDRINNYLSGKTELKNKLIQALSYPAIIVVITSLAIVFLLIFVVPEFETVFKDYQAELPAITSTVLAISHFFSDQLLIIVIVFIAFIIGVYQFARTKNGYRILSRFYLSIPFVGNLMKQLFISRICLFLSVLLEAKVTLLEALEISKSSIHNYYYEKELKRMISYTSRGDRLSDSISRSRLFPEMVIQMLTVGEETANIHQMLQSVSDHYKAEVDRFTARISTLIEPLMIVVLGLIVGTIVVSIYLPMFELGTLVK